MINQNYISCLIFMCLLFSCAKEKKTLLTQIKGKWINEHNNFLEIRDTTSNNNFIGKNVRTIGKHLQIINDTISFQDRYTTSEDNFSKQHVDKTDFKLIALSDSFLNINPVSDLSRMMFDQDTVKFVRQEYSVNSEINFEKIIFHTTGCFGSCPIYHLEIDNSGKTRLHREKIYKKENKKRATIDSLNIGYYKGQLSRKLLDQLNHKIQTCNLEKLNFRGVTCCDGSITTIIIYYNGKRKYLKDMFPPKIAENLINHLYVISEKAMLQKTNILFELEK